MTIRRLAPAILGLSVVVTFSGCGSSAEQGREAAAANTSSSSESNSANLAAEDWPSRVVCPEGSSWTFTLQIANATSLPLNMAAGDIDCADWSGVSTPATAISGSVVPVKDNVKYRLEPRDNADRWWSMAVFSGDTEIGQFRVTIPRGASHVALNTKRDANYCQRVYIGEDPTRTPSTDEKVQIDDRTLMLLSDGKEIYVKACGPFGEITDPAT